jgi:hypothetical protein
MPIRKFHSVADIPAPSERRPFDPENLRLAFSLARFCYELRPLKLRPGVHKHRSIAEAQRWRDEQVEYSTRDRP